MANELAVVPSTYGDQRIVGVQRLGNILAASGYFADAQEMAQAAVKVMAGEELGIAPVASMMGINIIKGKVALSANLMAAQVRKHGYNYRIESMDSTGAVIEFIGKDGKPIGKSSFNEADAKAAGVFSDMYKKYPRNMYFSRAMSNGVKWYCPEICSGLPVYTPEELGTAVDSEGEIIRQTPITANTQAAADSVAERKIEELQAKSKDFSMLRAFGEIKKDIGDEAYYRILGANGFEKSTEITDASKGREVYREMKEYQKALALKVTDADLPDEWKEGRE